MGDDMRTNLGRVQRAVGMAVMTGGMAIPVMAARGGVGGFAAIVVLGGHTKAKLALAFIATGSLLLGYITYANTRRRRDPRASLPSLTIEPMLAASRTPRAPAPSRTLFAERSDAVTADDHVGHEARPARLV